MTLIGLAILVYIGVFLLSAISDGIYEPFIWIVVMAGFWAIVCHIGPWMAPVLGAVIILWVRGLPI